MINFYSVDVERPCVCAYGALERVVGGGEGEEAESDEYVCWL